MARTRRDLTIPDNAYALSVHREPEDPAGIAAPNLDGYHGAYLPRRELDARSDQRSAGTTRCYNRLRRPTGDPKGYPDDRQRIRDRRIR